MLTIRDEQMVVLEQAVFVSFGRKILESLREHAPEALLGLSELEVSQRLTMALDRAGMLGIVIARDLRAFIRLCFLIGPDFCSYEPFESLLMEGDGGAACLFGTATADDWARVAIEEIIGRYFAGPLSPGGARDQERAPGPDLTLSPLRAEHAEDVYCYGSHPDIWRMAGAVPLRSAQAVREDIQKAVASPARQRYAVHTGAGGFAGVVELSALDDAVELSYWIRRDQWGKGIATAAIRSLWSQRALLPPDSLVYAHCAAQNLLSLGVLMKAEFMLAEPEQSGSLLRFVRATDNF